MAPKDQGQVFSVSGVASQIVAQVTRFLERSVALKERPKPPDAIVAVQDGTRKQSSGEKRGPLLPPAFAAALHVGRLAFSHDGKRLASGGGGP